MGAAPLLSSLGGEINKKEGGTNSGNLFGSSNPHDLKNLQNTAYSGIQNAQDASKYYNPATGTQEATNQVQGNGILNGLFGQGGTLQNTIDQEKQQANQGFSLTPEDRTAYGQISGDIARQFGQQDQSLAQALSDRGLSNSGVAGAAFTGSSGNKMEQLAEAQQKIANDRFNANIQKLGQTRSFLANLGQQGANDIQQQYGRNQQGVNQNLENSKQAQGLLGNIQGQANTNLEQTQQTSHPSDFMSGLTGAMQLGSQGAKTYGSMS